MLAEWVLTAGVSGDARTYLEAGIRASITKVVELGEGLDYLENIVGGTTDTVRDLYVPTQTDIDTYVDNVLRDYDAALGDDRVEIVCK